MKLKALVEIEIELPNDKMTLVEAYGTDDPVACVRQDFDNDAVFLLENPSKLVSVEIL